MDEELDILDKQGNLTGMTAGFTKVHREGMIHRASQVWVYNSKRELLIHKRSTKVFMFRELWDSSSGGHIIAGEDPEVAAKREFQEELGIRAESLEFGGIFRDHMEETDLINDEFDYVYFYRYDGDVADISFDDFEMTEIKFVTPDELLDMEKKGITVPHKEGYFRFIIECMDRLLTPSQP